jgi:hypothetical protein
VSATDASQPFGGWDDALRAELEANTANAVVGTALLLEDERARSWEPRVPPGGRVGFHRTGDAELVFTTIEFLDSANPPLPLATAPVW